MEERCKGITKTGARCKNRAHLIDGYCRVHLNQREEKEAKVKSQAAARSEPNSLSAQELIFPLPEEREHVHSAKPSAAAAHKKTPNPQTALTKLLISIAALVAVVLVVTRSKR